jgi:hypothetical protein
MISGSYVIALATSRALKGCPARQNPHVPRCARDALMAAGRATAAVGSVIGRWPLADEEQAETSMARFGQASDRPGGGQVCGRATQAT